MKEAVISEEDMRLGWYLKDLIEVDKAAYNGGREKKRDVESGSYPSPAYILPQQTLIAWEDGLRWNINEPSTSDATSSCDNFI